MAFLVVEQIFGCRGDRLIAASVNATFDVLPDRHGPRFFR
jgi:hypothetical protein